MLNMKKYLIINFIIIGIINITIQENNEDDGKYIPDSIPVWEHERQDYTFSYGVKDFHTGDVKNQWEKKVGDTIHGHYSVLEPDGSLRIVQYTADDKNGFNAIVKHEGPTYHPVTKISTSHTEVHIEPQKHIEESKPIPETQENLENTQDVQPIDAYLYIPSQQNDDSPIDSKTKILHYELVSDDKYQHYLSYEPPNKYKNHKTAIQPHFKINSKDNLKSLNYDLLAPVTLDLSQLNLDHYQHGVLVEPQIETGFRPIKKSKEEVIEGKHLPNIPNTYISNKKPITTPGLKSFASSGNIQQRGPVVFPKRRIIQIAPVPSKKTGISYTEHVTYFPDDY